MMKKPISTIECVRADSMLYGAELGSSNPWGLAMLRLPENPDTNIARGIIYMKQIFYKLFLNI